MILVYGGKDEAFFMSVENHDTQITFYRAFPLLWIKMEDKIVLIVIAKSLILICTLQMFYFATLLLIFNVK